MKRIKFIIILKFFVIFTVNIFANTTENNTVKPYKFIGEIGGFYPIINEPEHYLRGTGIFKLDAIYGCKITNTVFIGAGIGYQYRHLRIEKNPRLENVDYNLLVINNLIPLFAFSKIDFPIDLNNPTSSAFYFSLGLGSALNLSSNAKTKGILLRTATGLDFGFLHSGIEYEYQKNIHILGIVLGVSF